MPEAPPEQHDAALDAIVAGSGPTHVAEIGHAKVSSGSNFSQEQAVIAVEALTSGLVPKDAIQEHGLAALTEPRAGRRSAYQVALEMERPIAPPTSFAATARALASFDFGNEGENPLRAWQRGSRRSCLLSRRL
jgi:hypothetical protein